MTFQDSLRQSQNAVMQTLLDRHAEYGDSYKRIEEYLRLIWPDGIPPEMYGTAHRFMEDFQIKRRIAADPAKRDSRIDRVGWALLDLIEFDEREGEA